MKIALSLVLAIGMALKMASVAADDGIPYIKEPAEGLMVGGQPSWKQLEQLREQGVSMVINLRRAGEFDDFDEAEMISGLGMEYVHIPVKNIAAITVQDAQKLHQAIQSAKGNVFLHCTVGWRAGGLLAIERYLEHGASQEEALEVASNAHMHHAAEDVADWIDANPR